MSLIQMIDVADTAVMLPMAGAIAGWLVAGRAWKAALYWSLMFGAALSIVALSKIAHLGWAAGIPSIDFSALSGHTLRATIVIPVFSFVVLQRAPLFWRAVGIILGVAFSAFIGVLLVYLRFHTVSEVIATSILGGIVSLWYMHIAVKLPVPRVNGWTAPLSLVVFLLIFSAKPTSLSRHLVDVALYF